MGIKQKIWLVLTTLVILEARFATANEHIRLVRSAIEQGDFTAAQQCLEVIPLTNMQERDSSELLYLKAYILANSSSATQKQLTDIMQTIDQQDPCGPYTEQALFLLGIWQYRRGELTLCRETLTTFVQRFPSSLYRSQALFYTARCMDSQGEQSFAKKLFVEVYQTDPCASFADEAYFNTYAYEDYLTGNEDALKHLYQMSQQFPESPYVIVTHYLKGMDIKKTQLGQKTHQRQQWNRAIDAFQQAEALFETLTEKGALPLDRSDYFTALRLRAGIERAQANQAIAMLASPAKRQICLEYTIACYRQLLQLLTAGENAYLVKFRRSESYHPLLEECYFGLAQAHVAHADDATAETQLIELLTLLQANGTSRGYYLAKTQIELANIAMRRNDFSSALQKLLQAEEAAKGRVLSTDERLELWISQSRCQRELGNAEAAMLLLSKVINDDSISGLRLKAMLLRADMYEQQGRRELAQKQLVALMSKGGEWARQAKGKLEKDYGHH
jgi:tetratricopeptide (TPR) repeat protein